MSPTSQVCEARSPLQTSEPGTSPTCNFLPASPPLPTFSRPMPHFKFQVLTRWCRVARSEARSAAVCMGLNFLQLMPHLSFRSQLPSQLKPHFTVS